MADVRPPRLSIVLFARGLIVASAGIAIWALTVLPAQHFRAHQNLQYRQIFYENIAFVPILAVFGAVALLAIHKTMAARWPQLFVALSVIVVQVWLVTRAVMNVGVW